MAKRRFIGVMMPERKTPGRKRKNAATAPATTPVVPVAGKKSTRGGKNTTKIEPAVVELPSFNDDMTCSADEPDSLVVGVGDPLETSVKDSKTATLFLFNPVQPAETPLAASENQQPFSPITSPLKTHVKERKRRIRIDDDDESPTFSPVGRSVRRGRGRGGRGSRGRGGQQRAMVKIGAGLAESMFLLGSPEKSRDAPEPRAFASPEGIVFVSPPDAKVSD